MEEFLKYQRKIFIVMIALSAGTAAGLLGLLPGDPKWSLGFAAGAVAQLLKFRLVDVPTVLRAGLNPKDSVKSQLASLVLGLALIGAAMACAYCLLGKTYLWAMVCGIFLPRLVLAADGYLRPDPFAEK